jgi:CRP-like cAMP-binding protein
VCTAALQRKLPAFAPLTRDDVCLLSEMECRRRFVHARTELDVGAEAAGLYLIGSGWVHSYVLLPGGKRQVVGFQLPGDFILGRASGEHCPSHFHAAITDCVLCAYDPRQFSRLLKSESRLSEALEMSRSRDEAMPEQHPVSIGRRSGVARIVHLLLELGVRLKLVGLADNHGYRCPLSQCLIADALGLTSIHVNRKFRELREMGCVSFRNGHVRFTDKDRLIAIAEFDPGYLPAHDDRAGAVRTRA